ncbi:hypothetical protein ALQ33_200034 [Pseudomonas syringae pv. philadelphi]|uniref:Uncharacterized protein n=1 Tax=Pseudomonas syringae pv. philadelphi TaxID=251706 RepID=A0A3M3YA41_9PSED|nr:hypothetical protein ALQ33_200034 [Pseudomonas syringae pv. philadelphi]
MALVVQVFHAFEGHRAAALQGEVLAAVELGDLIQLVAVARQREVACGADFGADVAGLGDFVALGFFRPEAALFLHVVQGVRAVLRGEQAQGVAAVEIRFVTGSDLAGDEFGVAPGLVNEVVACGQFAGELGGLAVFFDGACLVVFGAGFDVVRVAGRADVEVAADVEGQVVAGLGLAGEDVDVARGVDVHVATGSDRRRKVLDVAGHGRFTTAGDDLVILAAVGFGQQVDVAAGRERQVATGAHGAVVGDVATGVEGKVFPGSDGAASVGHGAHADAVTNLNRRAVVENVAFDSGEADTPATDFPGHGVANAVLRGHLQVVAGVDQAALIDAAAAADVEVVAGAQGADVDQVSAGDEVQVTALNQAVAAQVARVGLGQVQHGDEDFLAVDDAVFHPHDVVGQGADLFAVQRDAEAQVQGVFAGEGVVHQVAVLIVVAAQAVSEEALAGLRQHRIADQALFVKAIAQPTPVAVGVDVEAV